jgi:ribosome-associated protein
MAEEHDIEERPSKSARKRELLELQALADRMAGLSDKRLRALAVDERLREALTQLRAMRPSGSRNRQLKHCVKFMDPEALQQVIAYLDDRHSQQVAGNQAFHRVEQWRDRLVSGGDAALDAFLQEYGEVDRQHIRRLCRDAGREHETGRPPGAARKLFRYLREVMLTE